jgi:hypothetical protein
VTQYAHLAQMDTLDQPDPTAVKYEVPAFYTLDTATNVWNVPMDAVYEGLPVESQIQFVGGAKRPIMPKDIMRTVFANGGVDAKFRDSYSGRFFSDARALKPVVG